MVEKGLLGNKSKQGFYKKTKGEKRRPSSTTTPGRVRPGRSGPSSRRSRPARGSRTRATRMRTVLGGSDKGAAAGLAATADTLIYASNRIPEIADDVVNVDNAMRWGFNWELGPFELGRARRGRDRERAEARGSRCRRRLGVDRFYGQGGRRNATSTSTRGRRRDVRAPAGSVDLAAAQEGRRRGGAATPARRSSTWATASAASSSTPR